MRQRRIRFASGLILIAIGIIVGSVILKDLDAWYKTWLLTAIVGLVLTPLFLIHRLLPPPIEMTAWKDTVEFEFTGMQLAREFAELNECEWSES